MIKNKQLGRLVMAAVTAMSIWGFLFTQTTPEHNEELHEILHSTLEEFMV